MILRVLLLAASCTGLVIPRQLNDGTVPPSPYIDEHSAYSTVFNSSADGIAIMASSTSGTGGTRNADTTAASSLQFKLHGVPGGFFNFRRTQKKYQSMFFPKNTQGHFVFNMDRPVVVNRDDDGPHPRGLSMLMPFDVDGRYDLTDFKMLFPMDFITENNLLNDELFKGPDVLYHYPSSPSARFNFVSPLLVMEFGEVTNQPGAERVVADNFFENIAMSLVKANHSDEDDLIDLFHSSYCSAYSKDPAGGLCIKVAESHTDIMVYPAFENGTTRFNYNGAFAAIESHGLTQRDLASIQIETVPPQPNERYCKDFTKCLREESYVTLPLSEVIPQHAEDSPRNPKYSQVIFPDLVHISEPLDKRDLPTDECPRDSSGSDSCEPVTWGNLFSHALFGKPQRFCDSD